MSSINEVMSSDKLQVIEEILKQQREMDIEVQPNGSIKAVERGSKKEHKTPVKVLIQQLVEEGWSY